MLHNPKVGIKRCRAVPVHVQLRLNTLLLGLFLTIGLLGCPQRVARPEPQWLQSADEVLKRTTLEEGHFTSIKGDAKLKVKSPRANGSVGIYVAVSRPANLHLETFGFFGQPEAILTSDGRTFGLYQSSEGKYYRGPATPQNVSRFLPVVLPAEELVSIMLGTVPRIPSHEVVFNLTPDHMAYLIGLRERNLTQTLWIDPFNFRALKSEVRGIDAYDLLFENFEQSAAGALPKKVVLSAPAASTLLELNYKDVVINEMLGANLFKGNPPPGVPVIDVDGDGVPVMKGTSLDRKAIGG